MSSSEERCPATSGGRPHRIVSCTLSRGHPGDHAWGDVDIEKTIARPSKERIYFDAVWAIATTITGDNGVGARLVEIAQKAIEAARHAPETCDVEWLRKQLRTARNIITDAQNFIHPTIVWRDVEAMQRAIDKFLGAFKEGEVNMGSDTRVNAGTSPHCPHCGVQEEIDGAWHKPGCLTLRSEPFDKALNNQIEAVARVLQQEAAADPQFPVRGLANYAGMAERIISAVNRPELKAFACPVTKTTCVRNCSPERCAIAATT